MKWTIEQAYQNWRICFDAGQYTSARAWWAIVQSYMTAGAAPSERDYAEYMTPARAAGRAR